MSIFLIDHSISATSIARLYRCLLYEKQSFKVTAMNIQKSFRENLDEAVKIACLEKDYWKEIESRMIEFSNSLQKALVLSDEDIENICENKICIEIGNYVVNSRYAAYAEKYILIVFPTKTSKSWYTFKTDELPQQWVFRRSWLNPVILPEKNTRKAILSRIEQCA